MTAVRREIGNRSMLRSEGHVARGLRHVLSGAARRKITFGHDQHPYFQVILDVFHWNQIQLDKCINQRDSIDEVFHKELVHVNHVKSTEGVRARRGARGCAHLRGDIVDVEFKSVEDISLDSLKVLKCHAL